MNFAQLKIKKIVKTFFSFDGQNFDIFMNIIRI